MGLEFTTISSQEKPPRRSLSSGEKMFSIDTWLFFKNFCIFGCAEFSLLCMGFLPSCGEWGLFFIAVGVILIALASLVWSTGFRVHRLSCPVAYLILPDQGSNPCTLQLEAQILNHWTTREI